MAESFELQLDVVQSAGAAQLYLVTMRRGLAGWVLRDLIASSLDALPGLAGCQWRLYRPPDPLPMSVIGQAIHYGLPQRAHLLVRVLDGRVRVQVATEAGLEEAQAVQGPTVGHALADLRLDSAQWCLRAPGAWDALALDAPAAHYPYVVCERRESVRAQRQFRPRPEPPATPPLFDLASSVETVSYASLALILAGLALLVAGVVGDSTSLLLSGAALLSWWWLGGGGGS